jgi:hypothetical protein
MPGGRRRIFWVGGEGGRGGCEGGGVERGGGRGEGRSGGGSENFDALVPAFSRVIIFYKDIKFLKIVSRTFSCKHYRAKSPEEGVEFFEVGEWGEGGGERGGGGEGGG